MFGLDGPGTLTLLGVLMQTGYEIQERKMIESDVDNLRFPLNKNKAHSKARQNLN